MQAEEQVRLLLLDEQASNDNADFWNFSRNYPFNIKEFPFPVLYKLLSKQPSNFRKAIPLIATWFLQLSNTVEHILKLEFSLKNKELKIKFEGQRSR